MNRMMTALVAISLTMGITACSSEPETDAAATVAEGSIAGTWKADPSSAKSENETTSWTLIGTEWTCNSCIQAYSSTADGTWQELDRPGVDGQMIEIVDDKTIKTSGRFKGKVLGTSTWTVSEDGQTMVQTWENLDGDETVSGTRSFTRASAGPEGSHAVSGDWTPGEYGEISDVGLIFTYSLDGDTISSTGNGGGYTAKLGGDPVTPKDDETGGVLAVEKVSDNVYRETYSRDGEVISVTEITIDGDTMTTVSTDPRNNSVFTYTATRQ